MDDKKDRTVSFPFLKEEGASEAQLILIEVYRALKEKGYNPISQLVGYLLSGEPAYITSHKNARSLIKKVDRDELIEELVRVYIYNVEEENLSAHKDTDSNTGEGADNDSPK